MTEAVFALRPDLAIARRVIADARPRSRHAHQAGSLVLVAESAAIFELADEAASDLLLSLEKGDDPTHATLARLGLAAEPPAESSTQPVRALALTISQTCNLACGYCYAAGGSFGGKDTRMRPDVARSAIDRLITDTPPGGSVKIAFMGGEPMIVRDLIRESVEFARRRAASRAIAVGFSMTTNATLVTEADAEFFASNHFAITVSLDGDRATNDRLRPMRSGEGSFDRVSRGLTPLIARADRIALSARVTATPHNLDLRHTVAILGALGFGSVGVSPLIAPSGGIGALAGADFESLLAAMIDCGEDWISATISGRDHPFANLATAMRELHRGQPRSQSCGAGRDYLAVDAEGSYSACHRFVRDPLGAMGDLERGIDDVGRSAWVAARAVERQIPCQTCWARRLCGGGCHHEVLHAGRPACDFVRGWLHFALSAYARLSLVRPDWFGDFG